MNRSHTYEKGCPEVTLTDTQERKLDDLWHIYGNNGPKHTTRGNHYFIQRFLDAGQDQRSKYEVAQECLDAVDAVLADPT